MLKQVADGVYAHESEFLKSHAVVVKGKSGALLIDAGITGAEMTCIADDLKNMNMLVVAGFSTHPHWDHVLWHTKLGNAPRYGTAKCAAAIKEFLANPNWKKDVAEELPPEVAHDVPLDLFGQITGLPANATHITWDGPKVRVIEHNAHAVGHASLLIEDSKVLVPGDMLSDVLVPMLDLSAADPVKDYLHALKLLEDVVADVDVFVPGHGTIGKADELRRRIKQDRAYVEALQAGTEPDDPRIGPSAPKGWEWVNDIHSWQAKQIAEKSKA